MRRQIPVATRGPAVISLPALPRHVAIIMDGNGRWAKQRSLPRIAGHKAGVETVRTIVKACAVKGIEALTLFAFSSENWRRPPAEVRLLMDLFVLVLNQEIRKLHDNHIRVRVIGERTAFPEKLQLAIANAEMLTAGNRGLSLNVAANYGGRWDITEAARRLALRVQRGELQPAEIDESLLQQETCLHQLPAPDLFIRSGGEQRISNFLLWQLAYTELYFTDCLWPDFNLAAFEAALLSYGQRERRFGRTCEQVSELSARERKRGA